MRQMKYELIGTPQIEDEYTDGELETVMVATLRREDGVEGDIWLCAGVRPQYQDTVQHALDGCQTGYESVRVFGDSLDCWCPKQFVPAEIEREEGDLTDPEYLYAERVREERDAMLEAVEDAALRMHRTRIAELRATLS